MTTVERCFVTNEVQSELAWCDRGRTTESRADTRLVRISCLADTSGAGGSARALVRMPSHVSFLI